MQEYPGNYKDTEYACSCLKDNKEIDTGWLCCRRSHLWRLLFRLAFILLHGIPWGRTL
jgi:hypothetical protein